MALLTSYITLAEANAFLYQTEPWNSSTDDQKQQALDTGRLYLDTNYICQDFDDNDAPQSVKNANAYLANCYLDDKLFNNTDPSQGSLITEETVKAGSVSSTKKYSDKRGKSSKSSDPCPLATAVLLQDDNICKLRYGSVQYPDRR